MMPSRSTRIQMAQYYTDADRPRSNSSMDDKRSADICWRPPRPAAEAYDLDRMKPPSTSSRNTGTGNTTRRNPGPQPDERSPSIEDYGPEAAQRPWESKIATPESAKQIIAKYRTIRRVGGGSFGDIYICISEKGEKVAVKFEKHGNPSPQLRHEYKVLRTMQNAPGFAKVRYFSTQDTHDILIMDLLGPSLEDQFNKCDRSFSLNTVLMLADQMIARVEMMHSRHLLHRDIKPANFVTCREKGKLIYCIDFGLSKVYRHPKTLQHIPRGRANMAGTPRYASINNHCGVQQSRRDDLESIAYMLIYFLRGSLPWQRLGGDTPREKYRRILEKKQNTPIEELCRGLPDEFGEFLSYSRRLEFDEEPNYEYVRALFRDLFLGLGGTYDDWDALDWDWNQKGENAEVASAS